MPFDPSAPFAVEGETTTPTTSSFDPSKPFKVEASGFDPAKPFAVETESESPQPAVEGDFPRRAAVSEQGAASGTRALAPGDAGLQQLHGTAVTGVAVGQPPTTGERVNEAAATPREQALQARLETPLVDLPRELYTAPALALFAPRVAEGMAEGTKRAVEGMTSPAGMAALPYMAVGGAEAAALKEGAVAARVIAGAFGVQGVEQLPEAGQRYIEAVKAGDQKAAAGAWVDLAANSLMALGGVEAVKGVKAALETPSRIDPSAPEKAGPLDLALDHETPLPRATETFKVVVEEKSTEAAPTTPSAAELTAEPATPVEAPRSEPTDPVPSLTATANRHVDAQRAERGLPPLLEAVRKSDPALWEAAMARVEADPTLPERLTQELLDTPRPMTDEETVILDRHMATLKNDLDQAWWEGIKAEDALRGAEGAERDALERTKASARVKAAEASDRLSEVERAIGRESRAGEGGAGTLMGRAFRARQLLMREDYSYAGLERRARAANDFKTLSEGELARVRATADQWREANARLQERLKESEGARTKAEEATRLAQLERDAATARTKVTGKVRAIVLKVGEKLDERAEASRTRLRGKLLSLSPEDLADIANIAASTLFHIGEDLAKWSAKMIETFGEQVRPHLDDLWERAKALVESEAKGRAAAGEAETVSRAARKAPSSEEQRLAAYKTRLGNRLAELEARVAAKDFARKERTPPPVDREVLALRAKIAKVESDFAAGLAAKERAERPTWVKVADALAAWKRAAVLTSLGILEKLTAAGLLRQASMPLEDIAGAALATLPGVKDIAARATIEGGRPSLASEVRIFASGWMTGLREAWAKLTKGETELDVLHGHRRPGFEGEATKWGAVFEPKFLNYAAFAHAALKAPTFRNAYERALTKVRAAEARSGVDVSDPIAQLRHSNAAYEWATRQIFLQDNALVSAYRRFLGRLDQTDKTSGAPNPGLKALATVIRMEMPIVKVPLNIAGEAVEYLTGALTGGWRAARALRRGVESLPASEADLIMRQLKKGALGLPAAILVGYMLRDQVGGFYLPGTRKVRGDDGKPRPGSMTIGDVHFDEQDLHHPLFTAIMYGATVGRAADARIRKRDADPQGIWNGLLAATLGLAETTPFYREAIDAAQARNPADRERLLGQRVAGALVPGGVSWLARHTDTKSGAAFELHAEQLQKRQARTVGENLKAAIPGLRQELPVKR